MHSWIKKFRFGLSIIPIMFISAIVLTGCDRSQSLPSSPNRMVIYAMLTRNFDGPHGVLNVYLENKDVSNSPDKKEFGMAARIWLVIVDRPETFMSFLVQTGQTISFQGYDIKILRIEGEDSPSFIEVEVSETPEGNS